MLFIPFFEVSLLVFTRVDGTESSIEENRIHIVSKIFVPSKETYPISDVSFSAACLSFRVKLFWLEYFLPDGDEGTGLINRGVTS